jgi:hypothetical protein
MREHFAPPNKDHHLQDEWANLKQYEIIFKYVSVLTALTIRIPEISQTQILDKFIHELKSKTRIEVELRDPKTPDEAYHLTNHLDRIIYSTRNNNFLTQNYNRYAPTSNAKMNADYSEFIQINTLQPRRIGSKKFQQPHNQELCFTCEKPEHIAANCLNRQEQFQRKRYQQGKG